MMKKLTVFTLFAATAAFTFGCNEPKGNEKISVVGVSIPETLTLTVGDTETLEVTFNPAEPTDKTVTWMSDAPAVATVDANSGLITALAPGGAIITVTSVDGGKTDACTLTVEAAEVPVTAIALDKAAAFLAPTETLSLEVTFTPNDATNQGITWSTDDTAGEVATVVNGVVTAVGAGTVVVTATSDADATKTATCTVTVNKMGSTGFKTETTWAVGGKVWSDVVMAFGARGKTTFNGGQSGGYAVDFRENSGYGDMFTWEAVSRHKEQLCPAPWRVPTKDEFVALDTALGGNGGQGQANATLVTAYKTQWGLVCGGICVGSSGSIFSTGDAGIAYYWSQTSLSTDYAHTPQINVSSNTVNALPTTLNKGNGFNVRCIKDAE